MYENYHHHNDSSGQQLQGLPGLTVKWIAQIILVLGTPRDHSLSLLLGKEFEQASKDWEDAPKQTGEKGGGQSEILEQFLFWKNSFWGKSLHGGMGFVPGGWVTCPWLVGKFMANPGLELQGLFE